MPTYSDPLDTFDHPVRDDRQARLAAAKVLNDERERQEAEQTAARQAQASALSVRYNERLRLSEYRAHGVEPPIINGVPTKSSFHLLRSLGWTVEDVLGRKQMVAPPHIEQRSRKRREDYDQNT